MRPARPRSTPRAGRGGQARGLCARTGPRGNENAEAPPCLPGAGIARPLQDLARRFPRRSCSA